MIDIRLITKMEIEREEENNLLLNKRIIQARAALCKMFNVKAKFLRRNISRKKYIIDARRFLIYYMYNELGIKYYHIKKYIIGLHHSTAIYQCRKLEDLWQVEKSLRKKYNEFIIQSNDFDILTVLLQSKRHQAKQINNDIKQINNQIKVERYENQSTN